MKMWKKIFTTVALAFMLCLTGLAMSGTVLAQMTCVDNGDGTVTDNGAGLMWQKATAGSMNWYDAMIYASSLSLGGHSDWRLPSRIELERLYRSPCKSIMEVVFSNYWSSDTHPTLPSGAWLVHFGPGSAYYGDKSLSYYVRAVRSGQ